MDDLKAKLMKFRRIELVHIDELGCDVYVKRMTGTESSAFQIAQAKARKEAEAGAGDLAFLPVMSVLLSLTICDADGSLLLSSPEDANQIDKVIRNKLLTVAQTINGMTPESREELKKRSEITGFGTSSPTVGDDQPKK